MTSTGIEYLSSLCNELHKKALEAFGAAIELERDGILTLCEVSSIRLAEAMIAVVRLHLDDAAKREEKRG